MICGTNLIPILITILCCGGLFLYFNLRFTEIKSSVEKQNRVLTSFITNVQQDIKSSGGGGGGIGSGSVIEPLATPEAIISAQKFVRETEKIVVSDDEESDEESDEDSDSDSDDSISELDEEEAEGENDIKLVHLQDICQVIPLTFEPLTFEVLPHLEESAYPSSSSITEIVEEPTTETTPKADALAKGEVNYEQMRVDDLRKIVGDKNLASKEDVKKLKKPELLVLLKN